MTAAIAIPGAPALKAGENSPPCGYVDAQLAAEEQSVTRAHADA